MVRPQSALARVSEKSCGCWAYTYDTAAPKRESMRSISNRKTVNLCTLPLAGFGFTKSWSCSP